MEPEKHLSSVISFVGIREISVACDVSYHAVYRWVQRGRLPRTDYTGETDYAKKIAAACLEKDPASLVTRDGLLGRQEAAA